MLVALAGAGLELRGDPGHSGITTISSEAPSIGTSSTTTASTTTTVLSSASTTPAPARVVGLLQGIEMVSPTVGFAIGEHGTILRTDDAGTSWVAQTQCGQAVFCGTADLTYLDMVS